MKAIFITADGLTAESDIAGYQIPRVYHRPVHVERVPDFDPCGPVGECPAVPLRAYNFEGFIRGVPVFREHVSENRVKITVLG